MSDGLNCNKPMAGVIEEGLKERMVKEIMEKRKYWYVQKYHYIQDRPGGSRYEMRVANGDQKQADEYAKMAEESFLRICQDCMMNADGTSMDPDLPITEMQLEALQNQKRLVKNFVNRHMQQLFRMLLSYRTVEEAFLNFFFEGMAKHYDLKLYEQAHLIMDNLHVPYATAYDFKIAMEPIAKKHAGRYILTEDMNTKRQEAQRCIEEISKDVVSFCVKQLDDAINSIQAKDTAKAVVIDMPAGPVLH